MQTTNSTTQSTSSSSTSLPVAANVLLIYQNYIVQCDLPTALTRPIILNAYLFLALYAAGVACQMLILPASFRLARKRSAFVLLLNINVLDIFWLLQQNWISVEAIIGSRLRVPFSLESYFYRFCNNCLDAFYIELAINRYMAVWAPFYYQSFYKKKNLNLAVLCTWLFGVVYAIFLNYNPVRRPFHCLPELSYFEPSSEMPKVLLPDEGFYEIVRQIYLLIIYLPIVLYVTTLAKMGMDYCKKKTATTIVGHGAVAVQPNTAITMVNSLMPPCSAENRHLHFSNVDDIHANLILERGRLYLICFLGTIPHFIANSLYNLSLLPWISDQGFIELILDISRHAGIIFHLQQPILMFLLSSDLRAEISKDFFWIVHKIKGIPPQGNNPSQSQSTNLS